MSGSQFPARIVVEPTAQEATEFVADLMRSVICESVASDGFCSIALAGGTTPHALYKQLAREVFRCEVPWENVAIFFGDERDVPQDHVESNYCMAQEALLDDIPVRPDQVYPMPADSDDLQQSADRYEQLVRDKLPCGADEVPRFDLVLLGMGGDGHTASLFPHTESVEETDRLVISQFVPVLGRTRMTFTFPLINAAKNVVALVTGEDKAATIAALLGDDEEQRAALPLSRVRLADGQLVLVMDSAAARMVENLE